MRGRDAARFIRRRRQVDATLEHLVEKAVEALAIALHHFGEAARRRRAEIQPEHAADGLRGEHDFRVLCFFLKSRDQGSGRRLDALLEALLAADLQGGRAGGNRHGLPESVPAWYTGPSGASFCRMSRRPPTAPTGRPPPITLPSVVRSGRTP